MRDNRIKITLPKHLEVMCREIIKSEQQNDLDREKPLTTFIVDLIPKAYESYKKNLK